MAHVNTAAPAIICVDWGSTNFRAFLVGGDGQVLDSLTADQGMLTLAKNEFEPFLMSQINAWLELSNLSVLMAGMVGSQQGWYEAEYVACPAPMTSLGQRVCTVPNQRELTIGIVPGMVASGVSKQPDVMRGEEVQIYGALNLKKSQIDCTKPTVVCLPGTHTKWAHVECGLNWTPTVQRFSTQMTGELHSMLLKHSILAKLADTKPEAARSFAQSSFDAGVDCAKTEGGLLHHIFSARSRVLRQVMTTEEVSAYLSGVLICSEVQSMLSATPADIVYLVGSDVLCNLYQHVLELFGVDVVLVNGDQAACQGMLLIAQEAEFLTV